MLFVEFDIYHQMVSLRKNSVTLTYFLCVNISVTARASTKTYGATFVDFDICYRRSALQKLCSMTLT